MTPKEEISTMNSTSQLAAAAEDDIQLQLTSDRLVLQHIPTITPIRRSCVYPEDLVIPRPGEEETGP